MTSTSPEVFVQYKGTDICLDFRCTCGLEGHFDGYSAYNLQCPSCGTVWGMPSTFALVPAIPDRPTVKVEADDDDCDGEWEPLPTVDYSYLLRDPIPPLSEWTVPPSDGYLFTAGVNLRDAYRVQPLPLSQWKKLTGDNIRWRNAE